MTYYRTDEEQADIVKRVAKQYGPSILLGIVLAIGGRYAWQLWQQRQTAQMENASFLYQQVVVSNENQDENTLNLNVDRLMKIHKTSAYTFLALFIKAHHEVERAQYQKAIETLQFIAIHTSNPAFRNIATLRLARIKMSEGEPDQAINSLKTVTGKSYQGIANALMGDAYCAKGNTKEALSYYQLAWKQIPNPEKNLPTLAMKITNLNGSVA